MSTNKLRQLFTTADSIEIGDTFIRYYSPNEEDEFEIVINLDDDRYEFTSDSIDKATEDDGMYSIYCSYNKQFVDVNFYSVNKLSNTDVEVEEIQLAFDIVSATVSQRVQIINRNYDEDKIIEGLESGKLATTTWHDGDSENFIDIVATGEHIARIVSQQIDGEYEDYR